MAKGQVYWCAQGLSDQLRSELLDRIAVVVQGWSKTTERWINYRSLKPIVSLLRPELPYEIQLWASWALLSLCTVNIEKYSAMCSNEGAVDALYTLSVQLSTNRVVRAQCLETLELCACGSGEIGTNHMDVDVSVSQDGAP